MPEDKGMHVICIWGMGAGFMDVSWDGGLQGTREICLLWSIGCLLFSR